MTDEERREAEERERAEAEEQTRREAEEQARERTLTQAQVDRIVQDRLARQKAQFADYDELKTKAERLAEIEAADMSELEKERGAREAAEKREAAALERARAAALRSAVVAEAARKNVIDPDAALALIDRDGIEIAEDGTATGVDSAMDSLLEAKPYLAGSTRAAGSADLGARGEKSGVQMTRDDLKNMSPAEIVKADNEGRLEHLKQGDS